MTPDSAREKKALITIPRMPYPLNSGGRIAIYDAIKMLSLKYKLVLVIIDDNKQNIQYMDEMKKFADEVHFFSRNKYLCYLNAVWGLLKGKPLQVGYFYKKSVQKIIDELAQSCDFFYAFMIRTTSYGLNLDIKKGHYAIDSMYLNYKKSEEKSTSAIWKMIYNIESPLLYRFEKEQVEKFDITTFVNKDEAAYWNSYGTVDTLPHGVKSEILAYTDISDNYKNVIAFIGRMDYQPNIDAVIWFCNNVMPQLNNEIELWIIGGYPSPKIQAISNQNKKVKILGFVDDPYLILRSCICTIAPMQTGGGLQTKILMAMAVESLVISTSLPASAIEGTQNLENIIIEDDPLTYATIINDIYIDPKKYDSIKKAAKKLILKTYSLDVIEKKLFNLIETYLIK